MRRLACIVMLLVAGCTLKFPGPDAQAYPCGSDSDCAEAFVCREAVCVAQGTGPTGPDGGETADASTAPDTGVGGPADVGPIEDGGQADAEAPQDAALDAGASDLGPADTGPVDAGCSQTLCGDDCVDTLTDPQHCGMCNLACVVGQCAGGTCQPLVMHADLGSKPTRIVFEATSGNIYWTDKRLSGAVLGRPADATQPTFVVQSPARYPEALAASPQYVAWSELDEVGGSRNGDVLYKAAPFAVAASAAALDQANPKGMVIAAGYVYWNSNSPLYLRGHPLGGGAADLELRPPMGSSYAQALAADDSDLYWADSQADIYAQGLSLPTAPAPRQVVATSYGEASDLVLQDGLLYWGEAAIALSGEGRILSAPSGGGLATILVPHADPLDVDQSVTGLAMNAGQLYYTTGGTGGRGGSLFTLPSTGGTPVRLVQGGPTDELRDVAVGLGRIFWTSNNEVMAMAAPAPAP